MELIETLYHTDSAPNIDHGRPSGFRIVRPVAAFPPGCAPAVTGRFVVKAARATSRPRLQRRDRHGFSPCFEMLRSIGYSGGDYISAVDVLSTLKNEKCEAGKKISILVEL